MRRAVITGLGVVSPLGANLGDTLESLKETRSGIKFKQEYADIGLRCHIAGAIDLDLPELIDRKLYRFMGDAAAYSYLAMQEAIADAGLGEGDVSAERSGLVAGSGGASSHNVIESADILREKGLKRIGPYRVTRTMGSTVSACLATAFKIKGVNYSITSACSTSAHCIGHALELIQLDKQDLIFAGGGEEEHWSQTSFFDAMGALSTRNDAPTKASRAYDKDRDGFVIGSGAGFVVVEELERAKARGAKIYAEIIGYGATSDGFDMVAPSGEGGERAMRQALATVDGRQIDYINTHGTSTPTGDPSEIVAIRKVFGQTLPKISSTKSLSGHSLGAAGVHEAIYSLLMLEHDFICASANVENLDPEIGDAPIVTAREDNAGLQTIMSNSFGFGGTNAVLVFNKPD